MLVKPKDSGLSSGLFLAGDVLYLPAWESVGKD